MSCPLYTQPYKPNLKEIDSVVCEICVLENCPLFFTFLLYTVLKSNFEPPKKSFSCRSISFRFGTPVKDFVAVAFTRVGLDGYVPIQLI